MSSYRNGSIEAHSALVLAHYVDEWGVPFSRKTINNGKRELSVYGFFDPVRKLVRLSTCGISFPAFQKEWVAVEICQVIYSEHCPNGIFGRFVDPFLSVAVHREMHPFHRCENESMALLTPLDPGVWTATDHDFMLTMEALGEPEKFVMFRHKMLKFDLLWELPIYRNEALFVDKAGVDELLNEFARIGVNEVHLDRPALQLSSE